MFNKDNYYFKWLKVKGDEQFRCRFQSKLNPDEFYICQVYPTKEGAKYSYKARVKTMIDGSWHYLETYNNEFYSAMRNAIIDKIDSKSKDDAYQSNEITQAQMPTFEDSDVFAGLEDFIAKNWEEE